MMKNKYMHAVAFLGATVLLLCGCSNFLEPKDMSKRIPGTLAELNELLLGSAYPSYSTAGERYDLFGMVNLMDDDVTTCKLFRPSTGMNPFEDAAVNNLLGIYTMSGNYSQASYNIESAISTTTGVNAQCANINKPYRSLYNLITGINATLDYLPEVTGTEEDRLWVTAQAHALRAYMHFMLVNMYAKPYNYDKEAMGVVIMSSAKYGTDEIKRQPVKDVYRFILDDLDAAEEAYLALTESPRYGESDKIVFNMMFNNNYRTSLPMVHLLKARVYQFMSGGATGEDHWEQAAQYASKVIDGYEFKEFGLYDLNTIPAEMVWPNLMTYDNPEAIWVFGCTSACLANSTLKSYATLTGDVTTVAQNVLASYYNSLFVASDELLNTYGADDMRKKRYIATRTYGGGTFPGQTEAYLNIGKIAMTATAVPTGKYTASVITGKFAYAFRLSEAYLIYAEAQAMRMKDSEAIEKLDKLRDKRIKNNVSLAGISHEVLLQTIKDERRREFCFETFRFFDLKRYGMKSFTRVVNYSKPQPAGDPLSAPLAGEIRVYTIEDNDPGFCMEIPYNSVLKSGVVQNPLSPGDYPSSTRPYQVQNSTL